MMLVLRRADERRHLIDVKSKVSQTFYVQEDASADTRAFGDLTGFDEIRILPGGALPRVETENSTFTYVHTGGLEEKRAHDSTVQRAGDFQRRGKRAPQAATKASRTYGARVFRLCFASARSGSGELDDGSQQERFTAARRHNRLCTVASPNGVSEVLHADVVIYSSVLDLGRHIVHALKPERCAWLHIVYGKATVGDYDLSEGDGIGISESVAVSLTAREDSEILLVDLDATKLA